MAWTQLGEVLRQSALAAARAQGCYDAQINDIVQPSDSDGWEIAVSGTIQGRPQRLRIRIPSIADDGAPVNVICSVLD